MNIRSNPDTTLPAVTTGPLPSSRKIFATPDAAPDLRVPLREIILSEGAGEPNLPVYDTSGPYSDPSVTIIPSGPELFAEGLALYSSRKDKEWTLTDCISFVVMKREELGEALTGDHHFKQAGFTTLLE